jgi:hypothetical protein
MPSRSQRSTEEDLVKQQQFEISFRMEVKMIEYPTTQHPFEWLQQFTCTNDAKRSLVSSTQLLTQSGLCPRATRRPRLPYERTSIHYIFTFRDSPHLVLSDTNKIEGLDLSGHVEGDGIRCEQEKGT